MKEIHDWPPNIEEIRKHMEPVRGTIFTYGDTIYNPDGARLIEHLKIHEGTHMVQQGGDPERWWVRYLTEPAFRLQEEVAAYRNQYQYICEKIKDRENRAHFIFRFAEDLSGPTYGNMVSLAEAAKLIRN